MDRVLKTFGWFLLYLFFLLLLSLIPRTANAGSAEGKALFEARCASCHGLDARGAPGAAKRLQADFLKLDLTKDNVLRKSDRSLRRLIGGGHGKMPRQASLTPAQVDSLVKYLRSLQKALVLAPREGRVDHKSN